MSVKSSVATVVLVRLVLLGACSLPCVARAAEHVTLRNGFEIDCARREAVEGDRTRLFLLPSASAPSAAEASYIDVASNAVMRVETIPDPTVVVAKPAKASARGEGKPPAEPTSAEMHTMLASAGTEHNIDEDLLAAVVKAESGGRTFAVSRTGARGLMQLMPGTASAMGVDDAFQPGQNIAGGTAYLDRLLVRYHDDATLALAAYNAGPGAVDKYHGVPPYRETRAYVARVIGEFNRRKLAAQVAGLR